MELGNVGPINSTKELSFSEKSVFGTLVEFGKVPITTDLKLEFVDLRYIMELVQKEKKITIIDLFDLKGFKKAHELEKKLIELL